MRRDGRNVAEPRKRPVAAGPAARTGGAPGLRPASATAARCPPETDPAHGRVDGVLGSEGAAALWPDPARAPGGGGAWPPARRVSNRGRGDTETGHEGLSGGRASIDDPQSMFTMMVFLWVKCSSIASSEASLPRPRLLHAAIGQAGLDDDVLVHLHEAGLQPVAGRARSSGCASRAWRPARIRCRSPGQHRFGVVEGRDHA